MSFFSGCHNVIADLTIYLNNYNNRLSLGKFNTKGGIKLKKIVLFILAVLGAAALGSVLQSLFNLTAIAALTDAIALPLWFQTIGYDLIYFMPVLAAILLPVMLISLLITALLHRYLKLSLLAASFGVTVLGTWLALLIINHFAPMPTLIALNRSTVGTLLLLCCSGSAVVIFQYLTHKRRLR
ncbi:hypothetical protein GCM10010919_20710 [Alishewanella longhuensis]|uniref:Uncharacterized protein n=1 Tax=Alishewanella longhuensis TaxID=1091037 RepID=A0ABQ3L2Z3_9ALTE|nr:hypothetical protein [Alishewanella longhuensis]GHG70218.1 hypothetical protein GCM10010919_20710 [Alishewanella longhuensis]